MMDISRVDISVLGRDRGCRKVDGIVDQINILVEINGMLSVEAWNGSRMVEWFWL